jgi:hypothetical protein
MLCLSVRADITVVLLSPLGLIALEPIEMEVLHTLVTGRMAK